MIGGVKGNRRENIHTYNFADKYFRNGSQRRNELFICENNFACKAFNFATRTKSLVHTTKKRTAKIIHQSAPSINQP